MFIKVTDENRRLNLKVSSTNALSTSLVQIVAACAIAAVIFVATRPGIINHITAGQFMSVITGMSVMLTSLKQLTTVQSSLNRGVVAAQDLFALLDAPATSVAPVPATTLAQTAAGADGARAAGVSRPARQAARFDPKSPTNDTTPR